MVNIMDLHDQITFILSFGVAGEGSSNLIPLNLLASKYTDSVERY